ncbi:hypothetical protein Tco_0779943 [Tanacetum coccineum]
MVELRVNVELKDITMVVVPKFMGEGYNLRPDRVEYKWTPPRCSYCKLMRIVIVKWKKVFNETAGFIATSLKSGSGYDTKSLLKQWKETTLDDDYDPYDDDVYKGHDIFKNLQAICNNWDIKVRGRKKK